MGAEQIARVLGDQEWMDGLATPVQEAIRQLFDAAGAPAGFSRSVRGPNAK